MPSDDGLDLAQIKRQSLFFEKVLLPSPADRAIVNKGEEVDHYPDGFAFNGERGPYPEVEGSSERTAAVLESCRPAIEAGVVQVLGPKHTSARYVETNWILYNAAVHVESLVRSALVDTASVAPPSVRNGVILGMELWRKGFPRRYELNWTDVPKLADIEQNLMSVAQLRTGRTVKYIRRAQLENSIPVACDLPTASIMMSAAPLAFSSPPETRQLAQNAIALESIDPSVLDTAVRSMSWTEILKARAVLAPACQSLRLILGGRAASLINSRLDPEKYSNEVKKMRDELEESKKRYHECLKALGISAAIGASGAGAQLLPMPGTWGHMLIGLTAFATVIGRVPQEIGNVINARSTLRKTPLFVFARALDKALP